MTIDLTRVGNDRANPIVWHYTGGGHRGVVVTAYHADVPHGRTTLADAVVTSACPGLAHGRAELATTFDRLPGLTVAAVPIGATGLLLGDHRGDATTVVGHPHAELAAVAAYLWLTTGRRLAALSGISGIERSERGLRPFPRGPADLGQQLDRLDEVSAGFGPLVVSLGDLGQHQQYIRLGHR